MEKSEAKTQQEIYTWFNNNYCLKHHDPQLLIYAVANGGSRNALEGKNLKLTGLVAGISDLHIQLPKGLLINVEVKTKTGKLQASQKQIKERIEKLGGVYLVVRSLEDFITQILPYLKMFIYKPEIFESKMNAGL